MPAKDRQYLVSLFKGTAVFGGGHRQKAEANFHYLKHFTS